MKHYFAWVNGSIVANDYPNKKDILNEISKSINKLPEYNIRIEVRHSK